MHIIRALTVGSGIGVVLTWLGVYYLFPELEDTLYHLELPHADIHLRLHH